MAIQLARAEFHSRAKGKNACRVCAYYSNTKINCERTGNVYDFSHKKKGFIDMHTNLFHSVLLPDDFAACSINVSLLANLVERSEKRRNSSLLKEYFLALPNDDIVFFDDRKELVHRFIERKEFVKNRFGVIINIHANEESEYGNNHCHILVTTRRLKRGSFAFEENKPRHLEVQVRQGKGVFVSGKKDKPGEIWKEIQNQYFEEKGWKLRVDETAETPIPYKGPQRIRGFLKKKEEMEQKKNSLDS